MGLFWAVVVCFVVLVLFYRFLVFVQYEALVALLWLCLWFVWLFLVVWLCVWLCWCYCRIMEF